MTNFDQLGLAEPVLRAVSAEGYTNPTPIQEAVIPAALGGRDIVGIAQTGTGKTAAFVLPLLHEIAGQKGRPLPRTCRALILAPTRELANQIDDSIRTYGKNVRHSTAVVIGGARPGPQVRAMVRGVDIVVATPGRLLDHMSTGAISLDATTTVILDEADQMLDLGFMPAIRRIMQKLPRNRRTMLLSATMPKQIRALADDFLNDPEEISVAPAARPIERIDQSVMFLDRSAKRDALVGILGKSDVESAIVFTRTKRGADRVCQHLEKAGLAAGAIHGNKSQNQRERTLGAFRKGRTKILVATDIAARGIDIDGVTHVVNFELPNVPEAYVHRIGRTARAGASGVAIALCDSEERSLLRDIEKLIGSRLQNADGTPREAEAGNAGKSNAGKPNAGRPGKKKPWRARSGKPGNTDGDRGAANANAKPHGGPRNGKPHSARSDDERGARSDKPHGGPRNGNPYSTRSADERGARSDKPHGGPRNGNPYSTRSDDERGARSDKPHGGQNRKPHGAKPNGNVNGKPQNGPRKEDGSAPRRHRKGRPNRNRRLAAQQAA